MILKNTKSFEIIDKFNTSAGLLLVGNSTELLKVGDVLSCDGKYYEILSFVIPSGPPRTDLSIRVKEAN